MSLGDKSEPSSTDIDESIFRLIKSETNDLLPELEQALNIISTAGHDPQTLIEAIEDYRELSCRLFEALHIAQITQFGPLFEHISSNLEFLSKQCTPLTETQKQPFQHWIKSFLAFLNKPKDSNSIRNIAINLADKDWLTPIDRQIANQFYHDLQNNYLPNVQSEHGISNLIDFPTVHTLKQNKTNQQITPSNELQTDQSAYEALTINRKNAWLKANIGTTYLLFPQTDIVTIETAGGLLPNDNKNDKACASLNYKDRTTSIYALSESLEIIDKSPSNSECAIILKSIDGYFGILCQTIATHTTQQAIEIELIPSVIRSTISPIRFITKCKDQIAYIIRSDDLKTYINNQLL